MAWTAPITFVSGAPLTAAQLNAMQANLLETAVAKATAAGQYFCATGANALAARTAARSSVNGIVTSASTTYVDLSSGPNVTVTTGPSALVGVYSYSANNTASTSTYSSYTMAGATTAVASDIAALMTGQGASGATVIKASAVNLQTALTPGSTTFTEVHRVTAGTGTWDDRRIVVMPF